MQKNNNWGDLTVISAKKEALEPLFVPGTILRRYQPLSPLVDLHLFFRHHLQAPELDMHTNILIFPEARRTSPLTGITLMQLEFAGYMAPVFFFD